MYLIDKLIQKIIDQNRFIRRLILCAIDLILLASSFLITNIILFDKLIGLNSLSNTLFTILILDLIGLLIYIFLGKYKGITQYASSIDLYSLALKNFLITILLILILSLTDFKLYNLKFWIIFWIIKTTVIGGTNFVFRDILQKLNSGKFNSKTKIAIYGASSRGAQLAATIKINSDYKLITFFDDSPQLWGRNLGGIKILNPIYIEKFSKIIDKIFISEPDKIKNENKFNLFDKAIQYGIEIVKVPSLDQVTDFKKNFSSYKSLRIEDLLSRNSVNPSENLINKSIKNSVICITGAGGSIGSELCREVLKHSPKYLILLEMNEENLYQIQNELNVNNRYQEKIKFFLGNATNEVILKHIFEKYKVETLFHAAAYKHVPIVEENPIAGIFNNVISTYEICKQAEKANLKKVILVSTDKAVRPTNVMGASKRLAEIVVQSFSLRAKNNYKNSTHFSMVRFGNVLGSSGSVVPLFQKQIASGGPITITHKEVTRYFMTIKEAAQLVIQASSLSNGGEIFILNMGKPIKIYDLAKKMIKLSGFKIKSKENPNGDIKIIYTGLRAGEKLYEELLINGAAESTNHPLIYKAKESYENSDFLFSSIEELKKELKNENKEKVFSILKAFVPEWKDSEQYS